MSEETKVTRRQTFAFAAAAPLVYTSKIPEAAKAFRDRYANREGDGKKGSNAEPS